MSGRPRSLAAVAMALVTLAAPLQALGAAGEHGLPAPAGPAGPPRLAVEVADEHADGSLLPRRRVWIALAAGAALTGLSFALAERADDNYERYRTELDPAAIERHYDRAVRYDRLATGTLLAGQLSFALGLYWWLVHRPEPERASRGADPPAPGPGPAPAVGLGLEVGRGELRLGVALAL